MARTRGAKTSSPSNRKKGLRKESVSESAPEPSQPRPNPPPVPSAPSKPPARRYLTRSGGRPLQKKPRVESSEPIDLTEQSPSNAITGAIAVQTPVSSPNSSPAAIPAPSPTPSPVPSPAPKEKSKKRKAPLPEPQIQSEIAPEESEARASPILPVAEEVSYGASASSKRIFLSKDTWNLGARRLSSPANPFEPTQFDNYRIGPKEGSPPEALYKMSEGFFFGPHHLDHGSPSLLQEKVHRKSCKGLIAFHSYSQGCYAILEHMGYLTSLTGEEENPFPPSQEIHHRPTTLHLDLPHQQSQGWPFLYPNIENCAAPGDSSDFTSNLAQSWHHQSMPERMQLKSTSICHKSRAIHINSRATISLQSPILKKPR
ncbi:hypothetical protein AAG906_024665 [Vitis piasezkii]